MKYIFWVVCLMPCYLFGQASLELSFQDAERNPITFHVFQIKNKAIGFEQTFETNIHGKLTVSGLSTAGEYAVISPSTSFYQATEIKGITLISNKVISIPIQLESEAVSLESVVVTAYDQSAINTVNAEVAAELSAKEISLIPIEGRDITRVLFRLPNISQATGFYPEAPTIAINGANPLFTNYLIDGLDNNENFLGGQRFQMPIGFTKNITALTNNFSVEHGLSSNGIINLTSKSGTNETKGEIFYTVRPGAILDASSNFAQRDLSGNQVKDGFQRHQYGFGIGGALKKDKTFYFINAEFTNDIKDNLLTVPELSLTETIRGENSFDYISAKIDHHWNSKWHSSLRANVGLVAIERQGGGLDGGSTFPSAGNNQTRNSTNFAFKNSYVQKNFNYQGDYQFSTFNWDYASPNLPNAPNVTVLGPDGNTLGVIGHPGFVFESIERTHLISQKFTFYKKNHTIKAGLQFKSSQFNLFGGGNPNGSYTVQLAQSELDQIRSNGIGLDFNPSDIPTSVQVLAFGRELRPNAFSKRQNIFSIYAEDQWSLSEKWNLNIGLRYDYDNLSKGGGDTGDLNNLSPRFSANYKLNSKTSLRGGYGIYYDKILYAVYSDALQFNSNSEDYKRQLSALQAAGELPTDANLDQITNEGNLVGSVPNATYLAGPSGEELQSQRAGIFQNELRVLNPNGYENPHAHQFMLGWQQKLTETSSFSLDLIHNRSYDLFRIRNLNAPSPYSIDPNNVEVRPVEAADLTRPVPILSENGQNFAVLDGDTLQGIARNVVMTETEGRSNYYALNAIYQKGKGTGKLAYRIMYTLSLLENNTEDINFRAMDSNNFDAEWGPSINDRTHLINTIVSYYPIDALSITMTSLFQSGQPINRIPDATLYGTTDLNGDGRAFGDAYVGNSDRSPNESRNSDRLPWAYTFDLSLLYTFNIGKQHLEIGAQVFNIFNNENLSGYANNATQSNQIQVGPIGTPFVQRNAAPPRQFQFSVRYLF